MSKTEIRNIEDEIRKHSIALHELYDRRLKLLGQQSSDGANGVVPERYTIQPIVDSESWKFYKKQSSAFWLPEEVSLADERKHYKSLTPPEQRVIELCLAFLSRADIVMVEALSTCLRFTSSSPEENMFYSMQSAIECIHSELYAEMIQAIVPLEQERKRIFDAVDKLKSGKLKSKWMEKYMRTRCSNATLLLVYICVEGIFFLAPFQIQFWFKSKNKLPGIIFGNELISRDEHIHKSKGESKYRSLPDDEKLTEKDAHRLVQEAVDLEIAFTKEVLPEPIDDLNSKDIITYIKMLGDNILRACDYSPIYNCDPNSVPGYMKNGSMEIKTNFYEGKVGNYSQKINGESGTSIDPFAADYATHL